MKDFADYVHGLWATQSALIWTVIALLAGIAIIKHLWDDVKFFTINTWHSFPIIGRIAKLSKKTALRGSWFSGEDALCSTYYSFYSKFDRGVTSFDEADDYLRKAGDSGRSSMPLWAWAIIVLMVVAEAFGFSYVLSGHMGSNISANTQFTLALGVCFAVSAALVGFTHIAGHQFYVNEKIGLMNELRSQVPIEQRVNYDINTDVSLDHTKVDSKDPSYIKMFNRIQKTKKSWGMTMTTIIIIGCIAAASVIVRWGDFNANAAAEASGQRQVEQVTTAIKSTEDIMDMAQSDPEAASKAVQDMAEKNAVMDSKSYAAGASITAYLTLSIIFIGIQVLGWYLGYLYGFAGKESKQAARIRRQFSTREDFLENYERWREIVENVAQDKLSALQSHIASRVQNDPMAGKEQHQFTASAHKRTFLIYVADKKAQKANRNDQPAAPVIEEAVA